MGYCSLQDVKSLLVHRSITTTTTVTEDDINKFITMVDSRINFYLKLHGITDSHIEETAIKNGLRELATLMAAGITESKFKADSGDSEGKERVNEYYKEGKAMLDTLLEKLSDRPISPSADLGVDELEPHFYINEEQW